jgi:exodeoxyribonuclease V alpha subunit
MKLKTKLKKKIFYSDKNQYFIGSFSLDKNNLKEVKHIEELRYAKDFIGTGYIGNIKSNVEYFIEGDFIDTPKYGKQFSISSFNQIMPMTNAKIFDYMNKELEIVLTRPQVNKLVASLGKDILDKITKDVFVLKSFDFISEDTIKQTKTKIRNDQDRNEIITKFIKADLGIKELNVIKKETKYSYKQILDKLKTNPYLFVFIHGVTVSKLDKVANEFKYDLNSKERDVAIAYETLLNEGFKTGNTYFNVTDLFNFIRFTIKLNQEELIKEIKTGKLKSIITLFDNDNKIATT